jgi:hypothetical protein
MPFIALIVRLFGGEINVHDTQDHLYTDVPEFLFQIYEKPVLKAALRIYIAACGSLLRRTKLCWLFYNHRLASQHGDMKALIEVAGGFEVYESLVEHGDSCVDEFL